MTGRTSLLPSLLAFVVLAVSLPLPPSAAQQSGGEHAFMDMPGDWLKSCQYNVAHAEQDYLTAVAALAQAAAVALPSVPESSKVPALEVDPEQPILPSVPLLQQAKPVVPTMVISFKEFVHDAFEGFEFNVPPAVSIVDPGTLPSVGPLKAIVPAEGTVPDLAVVDVSAPHDPHGLGPLPGLGVSVGSGKLGQGLADRLALDKLALGLDPLPSPAVGPVELDGQGTGEDAPLVLPTYAGVPVSFVEPTLGFIVVPVPDLATAMLVKQSAAADPNVIDCDINVSGGSYYNFAPNDPCYSGTAPCSATNQWNLDLMRVPDAWGPAHPGLIGSNNRGLCIADSGFHMTHTDLSGIAVAASISYTPDGTGGTAPYNTDPVGHGTAMTGTALATIHNGLHVSGITRQNLLAARIDAPSGADITVNMASAIAWCANNGANVISLSVSTHSAVDPSRILKKAVEYAWAKGALIVNGPQNDAAQPVDYPGRYPQVLTVNCVDDAVTPQKCANSASDSVISLSAPAAPNIWFTVPGSSVFFGTCAPPAAPNNCRVAAPSGGNSAAAAMVAGVASLVWGANAGLTNAQVREILRCTAEDVGVTGAASKYDTATGWGMVDAKEAIDAAQGTGPCAPGGAVTSTVWTETFEGAWTSSWYLGTTDGTAPMWHKHGGACVAAAQGSFSAGWTQSGPCTYNTGSVQRNWISSPWISLAGYATAELTFKTTFFIEMYGGSYDQLYVWIYDGSWHLEKAWDSSTPASGACGAASSTCLTPWSLQTVSLTPYVGKDIFMSFDARTIDSLYNDFKGWYVDDIAVKAGAAGPGGPVPPIASWHEDFEGCGVGATACPGWVYTSGSTGVGGAWQVTTKKYFGSDPAKTNALWYGNDATDDYVYGSDANSGRAMVNFDPTYPDIHVPATGGPLLQFRSWSEREYATYWDELRIEVKLASSGGGWTCLASTYTVTDSANPCSGMANIPYYPMAWDQLSYSLAAYAGQDINVRFIFDTHDGLYNDYWGWFVDEVTVVN